MILIPGRNKGSFSSRADDRRRQTLRGHPRQIGIVTERSHQPGALKIYRKRKEYKKEVKILKRFAKQKHARGVKPKKLLERLEKAAELAKKNSI